MALDPALVSETKAWLAKAAVDLRSAAHDLTADPPLHEVVLFHSQQACEKALKGFLAWNRQVFRRTHSLEELGEQCLAIDPSLKDPVDATVPLSEYAWRLRYPGETAEPDRDAAMQGLAQARDLYQQVLARLPTEVRPSRSQGDAAGQRF